MEGTENPRDPIDRLAHEHIARGDATGWFDELYKAAEGDYAKIPWADQKPSPWLIEWLDRERPAAKGSSAVVVGCGLGDDAEELARRGYDVVGFDVSEAAIAWARRRFPDSSVEYRTADLFDLPPVLVGAFDFVFEAYTLQALPIEVRPAAVAAAATLPAPGGSLLVVCRGREDGQEVEGPPWPLSREDLRGMENAGLLLDSFEDFIDEWRDVPIWRFRAHYVRPTS